MKKNWLNKLDQWVHGPKITVGITDISESTDKNLEHILNFEVTLGPNKEYELADGATIFFGNETIGKVPFTVHISGGTLFLQDVISKSSFQIHAREKKKFGKIDIPDANKENINDIKKYISNNHLSIAFDGKSIKIEDIGRNANLVSAIGIKKTPENEKNLGISSPIEYAEKQYGDAYVLTIGDTHGNFGATYNLFHRVGLLDEHGKGTEKFFKTKIIFQGDILADRIEGGISTIKFIFDLNQQLLAKGQEKITVIRGNHDFRLVEKLLGTAKGTFGKDIDEHFQKETGVTLGMQEVGLKEFYKKRGKNAYGDFSVVLKNMKKDPEGSLILGFMINDMQLINTVAQNLHFHTPPTPEMLNLMLQNNIGALNKRFSEELDDTLIKGSKDFSTLNMLSQNFLNTGTKIKNICLDPKLYEAIKARYGINRIYIGHEDIRDPKYPQAQATIKNMIAQSNGNITLDSSGTTPGYIFTIGGIKIYSIDYSYGKNGGIDGLQSTNQQKIINGFTTTGTNI